MSCMHHISMFTWYNEANEVLFWLEYVFQWIKTFQLAGGSTFLASELFRSNFWSAQMTCGRILSQSKRKHTPCSGLLLFHAKRIIHMYVLCEVAFSVQEFRENFATYCRSLTGRKQWNKYLQQNQQQLVNMCIWQQQKQQS